MQRYCPTCGEGYEAPIETCSSDGAELRSPESSEDPRLGRMLDGRFRLLERLGEGGMGLVYRAVQRPIGRRVAVKVIPERAKSETSLERFFREAQLASNLTHPNVVQPVDFGEDETFDVAYFAMELVQGVELGTLVGAGALALPLVLEVVHQVCGALTDAHAQGIVHRDLKPRNLKLVPVSDGSVQVKVLDFGVARPVDDERDLTETGHLAGTTWYMAPEYVREETLDHRSDLYAIGVMLYEMLCGMRPFEGNSAQVLLQHVQARPPALEAHVPASTTLPEGVASLYRDLLAKDPRDRCRDASAVRARLDRVRQRHALGSIDVGADPDGASVETFRPWLVESDVERAEPGPTARAPCRERSNAGDEEGDTFEERRPEPIASEAGLRGAARSGEPRAATTPNRGTAPDASNATDEGRNGGFARYASGRSLLAALVAALAGAGSIAFANLHASSAAGPPDASPSPSTAPAVSASPFVDADASPPTSGRRDVGDERGSRREHVRHRVDAGRVRRAHDAGRHPDRREQTSAPAAARTRASTSAAPDDESADNTRIDGVRPASRSRSSDVREDDPTASSSETDPGEQSRGDASSGTKKRDESAFEGRSLDDMLDRLEHVPPSRDVR